MEVNIMNYKHIILLPITLLSLHTTLLKAHIDECVQDYLRHVNKLTESMAKDVQKNIKKFAISPKGKGISFNLAELSLPSLETLSDYSKTMRSFMVISQYPKQAVIHSLELNKYPICQNNEMCISFTNFSISYLKLLDTENKYDSN